MKGLSDAHHFRKTVVGLCMFFGPLILLAAMVIHPATGTSEASVISAAADHADAWYIAHLLGLISIVLAVPAVLGLMHMLREREVAYGHVGGGLGLLGLMAFVGIVTMEGFVGWQMGQGGDRGEMVSLMQRLNDSAGFYIPFYLVSVGFTLGMIVLALGLYRARAVQSWMAVFVGLAAVLLGVAGFTASEVLSIVGAAFLFVGLGSIGRMVLAESDEDWQTTPEPGGLRHPTAGQSPAHPPVT